MKIAVVGTGGVASALGGQLTKHHKVVYATRDPSQEKVKTLLASQPGTEAAVTADAVAASDVVVLAIPGARTKEGVKAAADLLGPGVKGKVLLDATNPLSAWPELDVLWDGTSGGELLAEALPDTHVYKAFNTVGVELMINPTIGATQLTMLLAGPGEKKDVAEQVVAAVGFAPKYVGPIRYARNLEAIAELWIHLGVPGAGHGAENYGRAFQFQVIS